ncbi:butyrophilin-like protein 8 [Xiphophorus maculatus]|uniref:butyrophilin-like protein 8 n=1 Tax=Xiphophorus maculatus TaxID=8083 RepID=UPI000C6D82BD|nr:butyrophilin-like protein 8 [Xiphophorus maculatus]
MKMISRILLLLILSSCLCAATFEVSVTQSSYQAEENHSITLEWTFTTKTQGSWRELFIYCSLLTSHEELVLYQVHEGVEIPDSQDEQFSGRVQIDKNIIREGRIRLHVSRLRTEDSGLYVCEVKTEDGFNNAICRLYVTGKNGAQGNFPVPGGPDPGVIGGVVVGVVVGALIILIFITYCVVRRYRGEQIFPCWNNKSQNEQGRNDGDRRGNGNQGDEAEEKPLQDLEQPNQSV